MRAGLFFLLFALAVPGPGVRCFAAAPVTPYYKALANPWQTYSERFGQYVDIARPEALAQAHILVLAPKPNDAPYEEGVISFPGPTCIYLDGEFVGYVDGGVVDLNRLRARADYSIAFYLTKNYPELTGATLAKGQKAGIAGKAVAPNRAGWDSVLSGGLVLMLLFLLGRRSKTFFMVLSARNLINRADIEGASGLFGREALLHWGLAAVAGAVFGLCFFYGQDPACFTGASAASTSLAHYLTLLRQAALLVGGLGLYVYVIGLSLFNVRIESRHTRGNLEALSLGALSLACLALAYNFTGSVEYQTFINVSVLIILILFAAKGFYLYKILFLDQGLRRFYSLSYICLTEVLPSVFLIRLLTQQ